MKYVSAKYEAQLNDLAETLMQSRREAAQPAGEVALASIIEFPVPQEIAPITA
jgi:hypothetical protein